MSRSIIKSSVAVTIAVLVGISGWSAGWIPSLLPVHAQGVEEVDLNPSSIASLTSIPGSTVTFEVDTANSSPFAGFEVGIFYNSSVLLNPQVDFTRNVLGNDAILSSECIDGFGSLCTPDATFDGRGVVSLVLFTNSGLNTTTPNGKLFSATFTVAAIGFSPIHIVKSVLGTEPNGNLLPIVAHDSYFTNMDCPSGSGILCRPPIVSLSAPQSVTIGNPVLFDASASLSQNQNGMITQYVWVWGSGLDVHLLSTSSPLTTLTFTVLGMNTVTLTVKDSYGASAIETLLVKAINPLLVTIRGSMFLTDTDLNYLPIYHQVDAWREINVTISDGVVRTVNPRHVLEWVYITNSGYIPVQSVKVNEHLPLDWKISPASRPEMGVHVYFGNTSSLATNKDITQLSTISVSTGSPESIQVAIPNFNTTEIGHPLMPGQSFLVSVTLTYALIGTSQSVATYPRYFSSTAHIEAWTMTGFVGNNPGDINLFGAEFFALARAVSKSNP